MELGDSGGLDVSVLVFLLWRDLDTSVCVSEKESVFVCVC